MRVVDRLMFIGGVRALSAKGIAADNSARANLTPAKSPRFKVCAGATIREELSERIRNWRDRAGTVQDGLPVMAKQQHARRKGFTIVRGGSKPMRASLNGETITLTAAAVVQGGRQDAPEVRKWGTQESVDAARPMRELPRFNPFLKRRTEIKKDIEVRMPSAPKEKRYFGTVKATKGNQILAEVNPVGDADSWSAYFPKDIFKERVPKVGEEFEYTVTPFGQYNIARARILPKRVMEDQKDIGFDEQALLDWAAKLHV
jgi:hypothetical protein